MSTKPETKSSATQANAPEVAEKPKAKPTRSVAGEPPEKFRAALQELEGERTALAKAAIENMKPGKPFDPAVYFKAYILFRPDAQRARLVRDFAAALTAALRNETRGRNRLA